MTLPGIELTTGSVTKRYPIMDGRPGHYTGWNTCFKTKANLQAVQLVVVYLWCEAYYGYKSTKSFKMYIISIARRAVKELSETNIILQDCYYGHLAHFQYTSFWKLKKKFFTPLYWIFQVDIEIPNHSDGTPKSHKFLQKLLENPGRRIQKLVVSGR